MAKQWGYFLVMIYAFVPIFFEVSPGVISAPVLGFTTLFVPYLVAKYRLGHRKTIFNVIVVFSVVLGIFSILSGYMNYLTDEEGTPQYVSLLLKGQNWYATPLQFQYVKSLWGLGSTSEVASIWNVYL